MVLFLTLALNAFGDSPTSPVRRFTPQDSADDIVATVNGEASEKTSPGQFVRYNDTNMAQPPIPPSSAVNVPSVASSSGLAGLLAAHSPSAGDRAGISKYLSIVQPETYTTDRQVGATNFGIASWFSKEVSGNACLARRAKDFYTRVGKAIGSTTVDSTGLSKDIQTESGGRLRAGWLWDLAKKSAGGDTGLALMLIGLCGHDDEAQGGADSTFTFRDDSEDARRVITYKQQRFSAVRADLQTQTRRMTQNLRTSITAIDRETANLGSAHAYTTISCPVRPSVFFSNKGLGPDVDIPDALKNEIQSKQNPDGTVDIPSKTYHIYDGAFLTCQMIEAGMMPLKARLAAAEAARIYRGVYLCQNMPTEPVDATPPGFSSPEDFLMKAPLERKCRDQNFSRTYAALCKMAPDAQYYRENIQDKTEVRAKVDAMIARYDAAVLYHRWYFSGLTQRVGAHLACTDRQLLGPANLMANETDGSDRAGFSFFAPYKPVAWTNARYETAKKKLATWMVDSKWTIAQHVAGAQFASQVCKPRPRNETIEQAACRIDAGATRGAPAIR